MSGTLILNLLTVVALVAGLFFMLVGAIGVWRLPDVYHRMIASSKCITLGITGMLLASVLHLGAVVDLNAAVADRVDASQPSALGAATKAILVIVFQFIAAPVAANILACAAHRDGVRPWEKTLSDDLQTDRTEREAGMQDSHTPSRP